MVGTETAVVFWSYAHADDESDAGRLSELAESLKREFSLQTATDLEIFIDRDGIAWGENWKKQIDTALADSAFLIPIITPRYFSRRECRRELLDFWAKAKSRGLGELVLPILYVDVPGLGESDGDSVDEAVKIIKETQYEDWTKLRLVDSGSQAYRQAMSQLARRLKELVSSTTAKRLQSELAESEESEGPDLETLLQQAEMLWPEWLEAVQSDEIRFAVHNSMIEKFEERRSRLRRSGARANVISGVFQQEGRAELPMFREFEENAQVYSTKTMQLDPIVSEVIAYANRNRNLLPIVADFRDTVGEAVRIIREEEPRHDRGVSPREFAQTMPFVSQVWKEICRLDERGKKWAKEANETVLKWHEDLEELFSGGKSQS